MSFATLPPEITSALLYRGAGSAPMFSAANSWEGLAAELRSAAASFGSLTTNLANGPWQGAAAVKMTEAAAPYAAFLATAAIHSEQAAGQAAAVATAFEGARAAAVPSAVIAANRAVTSALARANFFGFNFPAIAAKEVEYEEMWAQDVAAMSAYHAGASQAASQLHPVEQLARFVPAAPSSPSESRSRGTAAAPNSPSAPALGQPSTTRPLSPTPRPTAPIAPASPSSRPTISPTPSTTSPASPNLRPTAPSTTAPMSPAAPAPGVVGPTRPGGPVPRR